MFDSKIGLNSHAVIDQYVRLHGADWDDYERLMTLRAERADPRLTYLDGELELMTPSIEHEGDKKRLGRLIETYADEIGIELEGFGSWTLKSPDKRLGAEADECYVVGPLTQPPDVPDFAIEVVRTSGGLDKLAVYAGLGVPEAWIWRDGRLSIHRLDDTGYQEQERSRFLPGLDPRLIETCMTEPSQSQALRTLRAGLNHTTKRDASH